MTELTAERLRALLHYDPVTGDFIWLPRPVRLHMVRHDKTWNTRYVGTKAGHVDRINCYRLIAIDDQHFRAPRLAWLYVMGKWPKGEVDHISCDRADDRWQNLREASSSQNNMNMRMRADNLSGFKGVKWNGDRCKWTARIKLDGREKSLGYFDTAERAFIAYIFEAWKLFGGFANIDADYIRAIQKRRALETVVLWNLARPDYLAAA
jgi:hypothetical protein